MALAGFEVWRTTVYGSVAVRLRGAHFLPRLAHQDLMVEGEDLVAFVSECAILLAEVGSIAAEIDVDVETLRFRITNLLRAAEKAQTIQGVVWVS